MLIGLFLNFNLTNKIICHTSGSLTSSILLNINNSDAFAYSVHPTNYNKLKKYLEMQED